MRLKTKTRPNTNRSNNLSHLWHIPFQTKIIVIFEYLNNNLVVVQGTGDNTQNYNHFTSQRIFSCPIHNFSFVFDWLVGWCRNKVLLITTKRNETKRKNKVQRSFCTRFLSHKNIHIKKMCVFFILSPEHFLNFFL